MEAWKLQHYVTNFTEACEGNPHELIRHAKKLRGILDHLNNPEQEAETLDELVPFLDDTRAHVRQCAACVILNMPIEAFSCMPDNLHIERYDRAGKKFYDREWENTMHAGEQQVAWIEFVAKHKVYLEEKHSRAY